MTNFPQEPTDKKKSKKNYNNKQEYIEYNDFNNNFAYGYSKTFWL